VIAQGFGQGIEIIVQEFRQFARPHVFGDGRETLHIGREAGAESHLVDAFRFQIAAGQGLRYLRWHVQADRLANVLDLVALLQVLGQQADEQRQRKLHQ
jgi:hypothetical protein